METERLPRVTIGMPVYNAAGSISAALDSLLSQRYQDFELVLSDNASTDGTSEICKRYAQRDARVRYILQPVNIGPTRNFLFVLSQARAPYFMWAASDDTRTDDFLSENVSFLNANPEFVLSASPNTFDTWPRNKRVTFEIKGSEYERFVAFFKNCIKSHGFFYSVMRTDVLRKCPAVQEGFLQHDWLGIDWAVILFMCTQGQINRSRGGLTIFGTKGNSAGAAIYYKMSTHSVESIFPFYYLSKYVLLLSKTFSWRERVRILWILIGLNAYAKAAPVAELANHRARTLYRALIGRPIS